MVHFLKNTFLRLDSFIKVILIISLFSLVFILSHRAIFDLDIWLHLKTGEVILQNKAVPCADIFSFTMQGKPWVDHEWLFQAITYLIYSNLQADGLIFLQSIAIVAIFFILFMIGYRVTGSYLEPAIFTIISVYASFNRFNIRPDIFSALFFVSFLCLLRYHLDKKRIWMLIPLQILWVNIHGYFFLGPLLVLLFIIAEAIRRRLKFLPWHWKREFSLTDKAYGRLKTIFCFLLLACLFSPNGIAGALYPLFILKGVALGTQKIFFKYIQELRPTFQMSSAITYLTNYYFMVFACILLMAINIKRLKIIEILLFIVFFLFGLSLRNTLFFAVVGYIIVISYIVSTLQLIPQRVKLQNKSQQASILLLSKYILGIILIVWMSTRIYSTFYNSYYDFDTYEFKSELNGVNHKLYPKKAVDFVLENNISGNMFNDFNSGAYLIGNAYPKRKVFIDGRTELYGQEFFKQYVDSLDGNSVLFEEIVQKYGINALLFRINSLAIYDIIKYVYKSPQWKLVFIDEDAAVFLKSTPSNQKLIEKYGIDSKKYCAKKADLKTMGLKVVYPWPYLRRANFFDALEADDALISEAKEALRIRPNCGEAYRFLGNAYLRKGLYAQAEENLRAALVILPGNPRALVSLGECYNKNKDYNSALNILKSGVKLHHGYAPLYYQLGVVYLAMDDETRAIEALTKATKHDYKNGKYHYELAKVQLARGTKNKNSSCVDIAKKELNMALKYSSNNSELKKDINIKLKELNNK